MITTLDYLLVPVAYLYISAVIYLATMLQRKEHIDGPLARKIVHLGIGSLVILAPLLFSTRIIPTLIGASFILITYLSCPISPISRWRISAFKECHGLGTVYYAISLTTLLYLYFDQAWLIQVAFLPLVFGDACASIFGRRWGRHHWPGSKKSIEGSIAGGLATFVAVLLVLILYYLLSSYPGTFISILLLSLVVAVMMMVVEVLSPHGLDNLTIPLCCLLLALSARNFLFGQCRQISCWIV